VTAQIIYTDRFRKPRSIYLIEGDAEQVAKVICEGIKRRTKTD